jgi:hypothetical protein
MLQLFGGNMSAYGQDVAKGDDPAAGGMRVDAQLTADVLLKHLKGEIGIGCYPSWHNHDGILMAKWGCCDIDTGDWNEAYALATALRAMGIEPHVERSRSKGWHIWVFSSKPVTAKAMRRALKVAYAAIELPAKEANPKSETLLPGQVGNYVRLPYKGAYRGGNPHRQTFMIAWDANSDGLAIGVDDWIHQFEGTTPAETIEKWAALYHEPTRRYIPRDLEKISNEALANLVSTLRGDLRLFIEKGPQSDRSSGMVALAYKLRGAGYSVSEMFSLLKLADEVWGGKYSARPDGDKYLYDIIERTI